MKTAYRRLNLFDVPLWETGVAAVWTCVAGYVLLLPRIGDIRVGSLFIQSGWIGGCIAVLGTWSLMVLLLKWWRLWQMRKALDEVLLPEEIDTRITGENAPRFIRYLQSGRLGDRSRVMGKRLERALRELALGHHTPDVLQDLQAQAQADAEELESSYAMVRAFIWAIPIFGFIGTVVGIGQAIGGFASSLRSAEDLATIKSTLGHVVSGLAFAFETTFLGLVVSVIVMFPMNLMHRAEQAFLAALDEYYSEHLVLRIQRVEPPGVSKVVSRLAQEVRALHGALTTMQERRG